MRTGRKLIGTTRTYSISGLTSNLKAGRKLIGTTGTYTVTPYDSILSYTPAVITARVFIIT